MADESPGRPLLGIPPFDVVNMMKSISIFLFFLTLTQLAVSSEKNRKSFTQTDYLADFDQCVGLLKDNHTNLYVYRTEEDFAKRVETLRTRISEPLTVYEFYNLISELCAYPQCYHTFAQINDGLRKDNVFPIKTYYDGEKLWAVSDQTPVSKAADPDQMTILAGSEISSINGRSIPEIVDGLAETIGADGGISTHITREIDHYFPLLYSLRSGYPCKYEITYLEPHNHRREQLPENSVASEVVKQRVLRSIPRRDFNRKKAEKETSSGNPALDLIFYQDSSLARLKIRSFMNGYIDDERELYDNFLKCSFEKIRSKRIDNLIIDIRGNGGGDPFSSAELLGYLIDKPYVYFDPSVSYPHLKEEGNPKENRFEGSLFLWVDGLIGSSSGHFASLVKYHDLATFIGEATGSTFFCSGNPQSFDLDHTKFRIYVGNGAFYTAVEGFEKGKGIPVDYEVKQSIEDVLENRDSFLEATLKLINNNGSTKLLGQFPDTLRQ